MSQDDVYEEALHVPSYLAHRATHVFNRLIDDALRPHGVSIALLGPLLVLARRGTLLQRDLVHSIGVGQPALVPILGKLEAAGLIERLPNPKDRRAVPICLTPKGQEVAAIGKRLLHEANAQGQSEFSKKESDTLASLMGRLIDQWEKALAKKHQM